MAHKYLLLGDSYLRRTDLWCQQHGLVDLQLANCHVDVHGYHNGKKISYVNQADAWVDRNAEDLKQYHLAVVQAGSNDLLGYHTFLEPLVVANQMYELAKKLIFYGCESF